MPYSIRSEIEALASNGYKEVTLLGQNVDSYLWYGGGAKKDFSKASNQNKKTAVNFASLLDKVAQISPELRIRFSTSNPQDISIEVIKTMAAHKNICDSIHLPVQSGSDKILKLMNRGYNRKQYLTLIDNIKEHLPNCGISMDIITGFCSETEEDHLQTLSLMDYVKYDYGYMFKYSERPNTPAQRTMKDNVPDGTKQRRLSEIIDKQREHSLYNMKKQIGETYEVLIESLSKKSNKHFFGRNSQNHSVVFEKGNAKIGDYVMVKIQDCTSATLIGTIN